MSTYDEEIADTIKEQMRRWGSRVKDFNPNLEFNDTNLICPSCRYDNLHQETVTIYDREDDAELTTVTTIDRGSLSSNLLPSNYDNPSSRRHGMRIEFRCETCGDNNAYTMLISQHKGTTTIVWEQPKQSAKK
jgi:hypothetical protein